MKTKGRIFVLEAFMAGFYVNITRSIAPIFLASVGFTIQEIVKINLYAYLLATVIAYVSFKFRHILMDNIKKFLVIFHSLERIFWGLIPISYFLNFLPICYTLAILMTVPTSSLISLAIYSLETSEIKRTLYLRSSLGSFSNLIGSITSILVLISISGVKKYIYLYAVAASVGIISSVLLTMAEIGEVKMASIDEEVRVRSVNVFLFLVVLSSATAIVGAIWSPYLMQNLHAKDYFAALLSMTQTATTIISPIFWAKKSYRNYRIAVLTASITPFLIIFTKQPVLHIPIAILYAFSTNGSSILASFLFAELSKARDVLAFFLAFASAFSQLLGMILALTVGDVFKMFIIASALFLIALTISLLAIPEVAMDVEKAKVYSRIIYNVTISGYTFSTTVAKETTLLALRLSVLFSVILLLIFLYRVAYYLTL